MLCDHVGVNVAEDSGSASRWEDIAGTLDPATLPPNARKLLRIAEEEGWTSNGASLAIRLTREDAQPFFATWLLKEGKWAFSMCRYLDPISGLGKLTMNDAFVYLKDPTVIYPEDPNG